MKIINTLEAILMFFKNAVPHPTAKNFSTQLGVHFEEVREMVQELNPLNPVAADILRDLDAQLHLAAEYLKQNAGTVVLKNRVEYLDALCDQIVTATGCAHMAGMGILDAADHVAASNLSKFDDNLQPIFDANQKIMKGPNYFKPDLAPFV